MSKDTINLVFCQSRESSYAFIMNFSLIFNLFIKISWRHILPYILWVYFNCTLKAFCDFICKKGYTNKVSLLILLHSSCNSNH